MHDKEYLADVDKLVERAVKAEQQRDVMLQVLKRIAASRLHDFNTLHPDACAREAQVVIAKIEGEK
jgi:hypothetical protein